MPMRVLSLAQLLLICLVVAGCATIYEGRHTKGKIFVTGNGKGREIFFLKEPAYTADIEPLEGATDAAKIRTVLMRLTTVHRADGLIRYEAGSYVMIWFCGDRVRPKRIQIPENASADNSWSSETADCPND
jgi:hypothetical protein